jgi:hypothetical protein
MRRRWILIAVALLFAVSALSVLIGYGFFNNYTPPDEPWMFNGAYATYTGQIANVSTHINLSARIDVTDVNSSHVQVRTSSTIAPSFGPEVSDHTVIWMSKSSINFQPPGEALARSYSAQITVNGKNRDCTVYEYTNEAINATYYMDSALQWPIRLVYVTSFENQTYTLDFSLNGTNIGALDEAYLR